MKIIDVIGIIVQKNAIVSGTSAKSYAVCIFVLFYHMSTIFLMLILSDTVHTLGLFHCRPKNQHHVQSYIMGRQGNRFYRRRRSSCLTVQYRCERAPRV
jgi:hypothetical protein